MDAFNIQLDGGAKMPSKAHGADAGYDLYSRENLTIKARGSAVFDTGVHIEIPRGFKGEIVGRSGLNIKCGVICPTGTVDSGYTGSICVKLYNMANTEYPVMKGDKIAQIIFVPIASPKLIRVNQIETETDRGDKGFGSSGR